jgi:hypothetical protein
MKRANIVAGAVLGLSLLRLPLFGQVADAATNAGAATASNSLAAAAAAVAEQQASDEKFKRLSADIENLRAANQAILDKLSSLKDDLQQIRADQARLSASAVSRDDLKPLAQRIEEVDKQREEDKKFISEEFKKSAERLEKLLTASVETVPKPTVKPPRTNDVPATADGFSYTIKAGDRLPDIVAAYNDDFTSKGWKKISLHQAMDANSGVDWTHLKVGQKIIIPRPPE